MCLNSFSTFDEKEMRKKESTIKRGAELNIKKKDIELKTGKKINVVAVSARNINKKRQFKIDKKIFFKNPLEIFNKKKSRYFI